MHCVKAETSLKIFRALLPLLIPGHVLGKLSENARPIVGHMSDHEFLKSHIIRVLRDSVLDVPHGLGIPDHELGP